ncbi:site-specific integrase [Leucobacter viscericola]|uniref:Site-specific integrase n=1 Tax=Leucobacter viscericola TaxID=2714935 RepID=A0A6G7XHL5_9MICO|nr:site-specific integrase [Leucobacter viscericola]QIK64104.1 site-specific integrase [Leucobacter viscericola]
MARAWVEDRWTKDATVTMPDGTTQRISPTPAQLKALKSLPEHFKRSRFGQGSRWATKWREQQPDGSMKPRSKDFKLRREAEAFAAELEDDIRTGRYIDPSQRERPFRELAEAWLQSKGKIKDSTYRRYRRDLDNYVLPRWATTPIGAIKREDVDAWVQQLRDGVAKFEFSDSKHVNKKKRKSGKLSAASIDAIVGVTFGSPLRYATAQGWIGRNPIVGIELPRDEKLDDEIPYLTYEDVEKLAAAAKSLTKRADDAALVHLLCYSGPRIGEATALQVRDLDLTQGRARINRTWTVDREGKRKLGPPKTWEKRWIPLPSFLIAELTTLCENRADDDYVFQTARGEAVNDRNWYNRVWKPIRSETAAEKLRVHDMRHVAASLSIAAGADVKLVQQMLGHKDANETLNTYAHLWPSKIGEVISLVEARRKKAIAAAA